ncbi:hypothetical protein [Alloalcanivorax xenomutans]|uniref:hypothetical protein n=1 Tax=Alloalcanivorax xenomutans TaxID=1094342 RepID=UPI0012DC87FB
MKVVLSEIEAGFSIWGRLQRLWEKARPEKPVPDIVEKFLMVFQTHGVYGNQIPRFFGHGLSIADIQVREKLLEKIDDRMLDDVCDLLAVRREWFDGASDKIYPTHDFYKNPKGFGLLIDNIISKNARNRLSGCLLAVEDSKYPDPALLILQEEIGGIGEVPIYRFHICNNWSFSYWRSRADLVACIAQAENNGVYIHGVYQDRAYIKRLGGGLELLGWKDEGVHGIRGKIWYPEDMLYDPELYLKNVGSFDGGAELVLALERWLKWADLGLMKTENIPDPSIDRFQEKLEEICR